MTDNTWQAKVSKIITDAINAMPRDEYRERLNLIKTGKAPHGVSMHLKDGLREFRWGGRPLTLVPADVFSEDVSLDDFQGEWVPTPDHVPDEWLGDQNG